MLVRCGCNLLRRVATRATRRCDEMTVAPGSGRASRGGGVFGQGRVFGILILPALRFKSANRILSMARVQLPRRDTDDALVMMKPYQVSASSYAVQHDSNRQQNVEWYPLRNPKMSIVMNCHSSYLISTYYRQW
jgi:hypothetical protein